MKDKGNSTECVKPSIGDEMRVLEEHIIKKAKEKTQ